MANNYTEVKNLPRLIAQTTGAGAVTQGIGSLDDAQSIMIFFQSTAGLNSSQGVIIQVSQFDPAIAAPIGVTQSTQWNTWSSALVTSSAMGISISPVAFRGLRLAGFSSAATGEAVAYVSKQILV